MTAAFNRNALAHLNREFGATFDLGRFHHRAFFDAAASRVEMHLESLAAQTACVDGEVFTFARGETIWTESSYKYDRPRLDGLVAAAGFSVERLWTDAGARFWVAFMVPAGGPRAPPL